MSQNMQLVTACAYTAQMLDPNTMRLDFAFQRVHTNFVHTHLRVFLSYVVIS
jgi:hypothetical protein